MKQTTLAFALAILVSLAFATTPPQNYPATPITYTALSADAYRVATQAGDASCGATLQQDWLYQNAKKIKYASGNIYK